MNSRTASKPAWLMLAVATTCLALTVSMRAQVQTDTETAHGTATHESKVEHATVVAVSGNNLVVKMDDGTLRDFNNVSESVKVTVDGKQLGIHDLKPGMHLQRTITTTTTPRVITTTQTVTGKVWHVNPPNSVILTMENGENQQFKIPNGQKFTVNGQTTDAFGLRKGMVVSATKVVEVPETVVSQQRQLSGTMPPAPAAPAADQPILIVVSAPAPAPAPAAAEPVAKAELPKTGSALPLVGLLGLLLLASSFGLKALRAK
jgi:LPXTG-motif cell wall-anchored protein